MSKSGDRYAVNRGTTGAISAPSSARHAPVTVSAAASAPSGSAS